MPTLANNDSIVPRVLGRLAFRARSHATGQHPPEPTLTTRGPVSDAHRSTVRPRFIRAGFCPFGGSLNGRQPVAVLSGTDERG